MKVVAQSETQIANMFDKIASKYDFLNGLLSLNQDKTWRRALIENIPNQQGGALLDVATGTGDVALQAMQHHPEYKEFTGVDISNGMLELAREKQSRFGKKERITFSKMTAEDLKFPDNTFDCLTISFGLRNVVNKQNALKEFNRVLKKGGGKLLILEFFEPENSLLSRGFRFYFRKILPRIGGLFADRSAYTYLPESVRSFYSTAELTQMIENVGFQSVRTKPFMFGSCCLIIAEKRA